MDYAKNIRNYYIYSIFHELLILGPIIVLFLIAKGLSFTEIMILQSVAAISVVIFEVPTGALADKLGRKFSILLGAALWAVSLSIYMLGKHFIVFMLAEIVFSLGATLKSGADGALIYDTLKVLGKTENYQRIEGFARALALYAQAVGSVVAGFAYEVHIFLPMIISIVFMMITVIVALRFQEPPIEGKKGPYGEKYLDQMKGSAQYIFTHEKIKAVLLFSMIFFCILSCRILVFSTLHGSCKYTCKIFWHYLFYLQYYGSFCIQKKPSRDGFDKT